MSRPGLPARRADFIAVAVSAACFSTLAVLTKLAYQGGARPMPLLTWRFAIVSLLMAAYVALTTPAALRVRRADLGRFAAMALLGYGTASVCFFFALGYASASVVEMLLYTYPAMVGIAGAVFFGERLDWRRIAAIVLTFVGCALVVGILSGAAQVRWQGVVLGLGAAIGYTVFTMLSYRWITEKPRSVLMTYVFGIAALGIGGVTLATGQSLSPAGWAWDVWVLLGLIILVPTFLAVVLLFRGMSRLGTSRTAIISTLEPLFTIGLAAVVLGDRLSISQWVGAALVLAGVLLAEWRPPEAGMDEMAVV
jgi:drug/metabolite transporter (DMT)-like permease